MFSQAQTDAQASASERCELMCATRRVDKSYLPSSDTGLGPYPPRLPGSRRSRWFPGCGSRGASSCLAGYS